MHTFRLNTADESSYDTCTRRWVHGYRHIKDISWLRQAFFLIAVKDKFMSDVTQQDECENGSLNVIRWLQHSGDHLFEHTDYILAHVREGGPCAVYLRSLHSLCWSPATHADFPPATRRAIYTVLLVRERQARGQVTHLPILPTELWLHLLSYLSPW